VTGEQNLELHHGSDAALGAPAEFGAKVGVVGRSGQQIRVGSGQQVATQCQLIGAMTVGQEAVIANALETTRQGVLQEEADELLGRHPHHFVKRVAVVGPGKGDLAVLEGQQAPIADGDAMRIAAEILQHVSRSPKGGLA